MKSTDDRGAIKGRVFTYTDDDAEFFVSSTNLIYKVLGGWVYLYDKGSWRASLWNVYHFKKNKCFKKISEEEAVLLI